MPFEHAAKVSSTLEARLTGNLIQGGRAFRQETSGKLNPHLVEDGFGAFPVMSLKQSSEVTDRNFHFCSHPAELRRLAKMIGVPTHRALHPIRRPGIHCGYWIISQLA